MHMLSLLLPLCYNSLEVRTGAVQKCPWKYLYLFKNALESLESTRTCCVCLEDYWHGGAIVAWKVNVEMSPHAEFAHDGRKPSYNSIINHQLVVRAAGASWYMSKYFSLNWYWYPAVPIKFHLQVLWVVLVITAGKPWGPNEGLASKKKPSHPNWPA